MSEGEPNLSIAWFSDNSNANKGAEGGLAISGDDDANAMHLVTSDGAEVNVDLYDEEEDDEDRRWRR